MNKLNNLNEITSANQADIKIPNVLSPDVTKMLIERIGDEYTAHYFYNSAANWCAGAGYLKAAVFFTTETANELTHAQKLQKYLVNWNVLPVIPKVETHVDFGNLPEIIERAYELELDLYKKYIADSQVLFTSDLATFDFLQEFRGIQTESVAEYSDLLNALQLIDIDKRLDLLHFEELYLG